ncbi:MAG TPA: thioredoxin family protein [Planctomycetota bacterium]|nr:thioredoxin family protein [Planctomycetota bacterium]
MRHPFSALLPAVAALCLSATAFAEGATWFADFDEASKEAAKTGKDMLVDFTGSDWCFWCKKLDKEVFSFEAFQKGVENDFILVALDFPNAEEVKAKVPNPKRNDELRDQHGIKGYPTILLMTPKGEVYGRTGYQEGGPEKYVEHLAGLRVSGKAELERVGTVLGAWEKAEGEAKPKAWDELAAFAETLDGNSPFGARLAAPLKTVFATDSRNEMGSKLRAVKVLYKLGLADDEVAAQVAGLDPENAAGLREMALEGQFADVHDGPTAKAAVDALGAFDAGLKFQDAALATRLYATVATWLASPQQLNDPEAAKLWAQKALAGNPDDPEMVSALKEIAGT